MRLDFLISEDVLIVGPKSGGMFPSERLRSEACWIMVEARFPNTNVCKDKRFTASFGLFPHFKKKTFVEGRDLHMRQDVHSGCIPTCRMKVECASLGIPWCFKADLSEFFLTCWCDECALPVPQTVSQSEKRAVDVIQIPSKTMCYCHWLLRTGSALDIVVNAGVNFGWLHRGQVKVESCGYVCIFFFTVHCFCIYSCFDKMWAASLSNTYINQLPVI